MGALQSATATAGSDILPASMLRAGLYYARMSGQHLAGNFTSFRALQIGAEDTFAMS
jgi:hypothetical protein